MGRPSMLRRAQLIGAAGPALGHIFAAYSEERGKQDLLIAEIKRELTGEPLGPYEASIRAAQGDTLNALATCIVLVADNIVRLYAEYVTGDEYERRWHGRVVKNRAGASTTTFGNLLWAAANAARHHKGEPFRKETEDVIAAFGITDRDDSVPFQLLEIAAIRNKQDLEIDLEIICESIDQKVGGVYS